MNFITFLFLSLAFLISTAAIIVIFITSVIQPIICLTIYSPNITITILIIVNVVIVIIFYCFKSQNYL